MLALQVGSAPPSRVRFTTISSDLIRVILEAVFDAHERLPAMQGATGLHFPAQDQADELPLFDPTRGNVDADDFSQIRKINQGSGAAAGVLADRLIRGIGPLSLNNEAIEELITTVVATTVKKAMEKSTWCFYACNLNVDIKQAEERLKTKVEAAEQRLEGDLANFDHRETERVQIQLTTSQ